MDYGEILRKQFRIDTNCEVEDPDGNNINRRKRLPGSRYFQESSDFCRVIVYKGILYMMCDDLIYDWAVENYKDICPEWFCKFANLRMLDEKLRENGHRILDTHVYFMPDPEYEDYDFDCPYELKWYDREEIEAIKGNPFRHALMYYEDCPDVIAVAACNEKGEPIAMAGASSDSELIWQIGINVLEGYGNKGLAVYLVTLLKNRILEMGHLPFYGTSESHSLSQRVAVRSGFMPAWCEVYTKKI